MAQVFPPDNAPRGGITFRRWFEDDVDGFLYPEGELVRDLSGRLRITADADLPDVDDLAHLTPDEDRTFAEDLLE